MVSISNVDLVMAALRSRLRRINSDKRSAKASTSSAAQTTRPAARDRTKAIEAMRQLPPEEFERTLVRAVLEAELGEGISEDPRFNGLVKRTLQILKEDAELCRLLKQIQFEQGHGS